MRERIAFFDTMRFFAAVWVFLNHFISHFHNDLFRYWFYGPTSLILNGLSAKLAVSCFAVIMGYLSSIKGAESHNLKRYAVKRYVYFFIAGFFINMLFFLASLFKLIPADISVFDVLESSLFLSNNIFNEFWCMSYFYIGSLLCFANGKYNANLTTAIVEIILLLAIKQVWLAVCLLGYVVHLLLANENINKALNKPFTQIALLIIGFVAIRHPESNAIYFVDGVFSSVVILVVMHNECLQKVLNSLNQGSFSKVTKNYMSFFLLHTFVFQTFGELLYDRVFAEMPSQLNFLLTLLVCLFVVILLSIPAGWLLKKVSNLILMCF